MSPISKKKAFKLKKISLFVSFGVLLIFCFGCIRGIATHSNNQGFYSRGTFIPSIGYSFASVSAQNSHSKQDKKFNRHGIDLSWVFRSPNMHSSHSAFYLGSSLDIMFGENGESTVITAGPTIGYYCFSFDTAYTHHEEFGSGFSLRGTVSLYLVHGYFRQKWFERGRESEIGFMVKIPLSWMLLIARSYD